MGNWGRFPLGFNGYEGFDNKAGIIPMLPKDRG